MVWPLDQKLKPDSESGSPRALAKKYTRDRLEVEVDDVDDDDDEAELAEAEEGGGT